MISSGRAVPLNGAFPDPAQMVSLLNGGAEGAFRATEQEFPQDNISKGTTQEGPKDVKRHKNTASSSNPKALPRWAS